MKIITISREFGSGGRELGKRLSDVLHFDYYDKEIITALAANQKMDEGYIEMTLENHGWRTIPLTFCHSFAGAITMQSTQTRLLVEQKKVIEEIAKIGKDCIIVGRNADVILKDYKPFNIFVCADREAKVRRCMERASAGENLSPKELERKIQNIDSARARTRKIIADSRWGERNAYHLVINTTEWNIKELTSAVAEFVNCWFEKSKFD